MAIPGYIYLQTRLLRFARNDKTNYSDIISLTSTLANYSQ